MSFTISNNDIRSDLKLDSNAPYYEEIMKWKLYDETVFKFFSKGANYKNGFRFYYYDSDMNFQPLFSCKDVSALFMYVYYLARAPYQYRHFLTFMDNYRQCLSHDEWYYLFVSLLACDDVKLEVLALICKCKESNPLFYKPAGLDESCLIHVEVDDRGSHSCKYNLGKYIAYVLLSLSKESRALLNLLDDKKIIAFDADYLSALVMPVVPTEGKNYAMALRRKMIAIYDAKDDFTLGDQVCYADCLTNQLNCLMDNISLNPGYYDDIFDLLVLALKKNENFLSFFVEQYVEDLLNAILVKAFNKEKFELVHLLLEKFHCCVKRFDISFDLIIKYPDEIAFLRKYYMLQNLQ